MLILDEATQARRLARLDAERRQAEVVSAIKAQVRNAVYVEDNNLSPANAARQLGKPLHATDLERRLKALLPNLHFEFNTFNSTKKAMYYIDRRGKNLVCAYEAGVMPEHSVIKLVTQEVLDPSVRHISRSDMPKGEFVPGIGWIYDETVVRPGLKRVKQPWGELVRGWRTVLLRLIVGGYATVGQIERTFGSDDRPEWAGHTGAQAVSTPW